MEDTLSILEKGCYKKSGRQIDFIFSKKQMQKIRVFLPYEIDSLRSDLSAEIRPNQTKNTHGTFGCENIDALVLAQKVYQNLKKNGQTVPRVLVLNLASATQPGGQTRKGASAQEEDLCRRTSLLLSLESESAKKYYAFHNARKTRMGSDAIMLSPYV